MSLPVFWQGRAGADGARGMPGETGAKVTSVYHQKNGSNFISIILEKVNVQPGGARFDVSSYSGVIKLKYLCVCLRVTVALMAFLVCLGTKDTG